MKKCLYCGEEIAYGDWVFETEDGDLIDASCFGNYAEEHAEKLGFKRKVYKPDDDPFAGQKDRYEEVGE